MPNILYIFSSVRLGWICEEYNKIEPVAGRKAKGAYPNYTLGILGRVVDNG